MTSGFLIKEDDDQSQNWGLQNSPLLPLYLPLAHPWAQRKFHGPHSLKSRWGEEGRVHRRENVEHAKEFCPRGINKVSCRHLRRQKFLSVERKIKRFKSKPKTGNKKLEKTSHTASRYWSIPSIHLWKLNI